MNIYIPNKTGSSVNGGMTFIRNIKKGLSDRVTFVDDLESADILFIASPMGVDKEEVYLARKMNKKIVLRVDNMPRKSRNKRCTPQERMKEFADLCDVVVYQSEWSKNYCFPICGDGTIIYNGVDTSIFYPSKEQVDNNYLFAFHGKNEHKGFWSAHYIFQMEARKKKDAFFYFIYDFKKELPELQEANYDFWNGEKFLHYPLLSHPEQMAELMRKCRYFIYPSICDSSPNVVLEARACGCEIIGYPDRSMSGTAEMVDPKLDISLERMSQEYFSLFSLVMSDTHEV